MSFYDHLMAPKELMDPKGFYHLLFLFLFLLIFILDILFYGFFQV